MNGQAKRTKIIATIGPSSENPAALSQLMQAGADIFRFNLKHNRSQWHSQVIDRVTIPILIDLPSYSFAEGIKLAIEKKAGYIAVSYVRRAEEIAKLRLEVEGIKPSVKIIAKVETGEALNNFSAILKEADAVMVARGDLGKTIPIEKVPFVQKEIILACKKAGKMVIVATEMLLSIFSNKKPTRAEVSDVANAVLEGSDAVMLSEETAIGQYPMEAVRIMDKIIQEAENWEKLGHINIFLANGADFKFGV